MTCGHQALYVLSSLDRIQKFRVVSLTSANAESTVASSKSYPNSVYAVVENAVACLRKSFQL